MGSATVPVVGSENDDGVVPKFLTVYFCHYLAYFGIHRLHKPEIGVAVMSPVVRRVTHGRIERIVQALFKTEHGRIIRLYGKIGRKAGTVFESSRGKVGVRSLLASGIFADIVRIDEGSHEEEWPAPATTGLHIVHTGLSNPLVSVILDITEPEGLLPGKRNGVHVPFSCIGTIVARIPDHLAEGIARKGFRKRHFIFHHSALGRHQSGEHSRTGGSAQRE